MEEFLKNYYSFLIKGFILLAVVAGLISYRKYKGTTVIFFIKILFYLFFIEVIGSYYKLYGKYEFLEVVYNSIFYKNYWWFTITYDFGVVLLFSLLYQKIIKTRKFVNLLKITTYVYLLFGIVFIIIKHDKFFLQTFPTLQILGAIIIILCCAFYFFELVNSDYILKMYRNLYFYITVGIFLWWIIITPLSFYDLYFANADWNFIILQWQIYLFANFFMYTTFAIGLLVSKPEK